MDPPTISNPVFENITVENFNTVVNTLEPFEYFSKYITPDLIDTLVKKTTLSTVQHNLRFSPLTVNEMKTFLGLLIVIGTLDFGRLRVYWKESYRLPMFEQMSRDKFLAIRTNLHLIDNSQIPEGNKDRFIKVRPIFDAVRNRCQQLPIEEYVSVDEQMVPFTGKLDVKVYMKGKPSPYGIKIYCLCGKSGLMYDFMLNQGANTEFNQHLLSKFGQLPSIVLQFAMNNLLAEPNFLFMTIFFFLQSIRSS